LVLLSPMAGMYSSLAGPVALALVSCFCTTTQAADKPEVADVVVVGGGLSGLWAASELQRYTNLSVVVLEGRARVGGRTESTAPGHAESFDLGAHWVGSTQHHIQAVIQRLGKETYHQFHEGTKVMELGEGKIRHYKTVLPWLPLLEEINFGLFYLNADRLIKQTPRAAPYNASHARHFDGMTVETFCNAWPWSSSTKDLIASSMLTVFGKELADISALQLLQYAACAGGLTPLLDATKGGAQELQAGTFLRARRPPSRLVWVTTRGESWRLMAPQRQRRLQRRRPRQRGWPSSRSRRGRLEAPIKSPS